VIVRIATDDARVDDYRAIPEPELLRTRGLFVAEGRLVVERLLKSDRFRTRSLLVTATVLDALRASIDLQTPAFPVFVADTGTLSAIAGFNFHRGCLALGERPAPQTIAALPPGARAIVLEGLAQADNVGSVFRNAAAFGVSAVILDPTCCDPLYRKALRTSIGTALDVPYARMTNAAEDLQALRASGYRLVALTPAADARSIVDVGDELSRTRVALLVGAEGRGLSPLMADLADDRVRIPMTAAVESLNVATATGIALHRLPTVSGTDAGNGRK
jgi:tRNA G18 (ribose-2'-O)-methylase SpoU